MQDTKGGLYCRAPRRGLHVEHDVPEFALRLERAPAAVQLREVELRALCCPELEEVSGRRNSLNQLHHRPFALLGRHGGLVQAGRR